MRNIWRDGFEIKRDDTVITLTREEINEIYNAVHADNGRDSVQYYLDTIEWDDEEDTDQRKAAAKAIYEDDDKCRLIWDNYLDDVTYDTGDIEYECVDDMVSDYIRKLTS